MSADDGDARNSAGRAVADDDGKGIHPVARLCAARGIALDELGNPHRACSFLRAALAVDARCVEALDRLFERKLLTSEEERELVLGLEFSEDGSFDWLRDMYVARLTSVPAAGAVEACVNGDGEDRAAPAAPAGAGRAVATPAAAPGGISRIDASSIRLDETPSGVPSGFFKSPSSPPRFGLGVSGIAEENGERHATGAPESNQKKAADDAPTADRVDDAAIALRKLALDHNLGSSPEVLALSASRAYALHDLPLALRYSDALSDLDPLCPAASYVRISTLAGLERKRSLFQTAHALVDADPKGARAWYAVGCYYLVSRRFDLAQRHFCRATRLDPRSAECWVAFGCSFAVCDESDQALASFRAAQRLNGGCHRPMLYMGMEYLRTNHLSLAGHFLRSAREMGKADPLCANELGVWSYRRGEFGDAAVWFGRALGLRAEARWREDDAAWAEIRDGKQEQEDEGGEGGAEARLPSPRRSPPRPRLPTDLIDCVARTDDPFWEPTIFNLGHCQRKERNFEEAAACFERCLSLCPGNASCYSALGYTRHLAGDVDGAIELYHQALSRKPDDPFASEMLTRALREALAAPPEDAAEESASYDISRSTPGSARFGGRPSLGTSPSLFGGVSSSRASSSGMATPSFTPASGGGGRGRDSSAFFSSVGGANDSSLAANNLTLDNSGDVDMSAD